jgi:beta-glucosidase
MPFRMIFQGCLAEGLAAGQVSQERLDDAVLRLLRAQLRLQAAPPTHAYPESLRRCPAHLALAREAARQSIVLLRNEPLASGQPVLPLGEMGSLALIGALAATANLGDRGSSDTRPPAGAAVTPLEGLRAARPGLAIHHADGHPIPSAAALAAGCDAAVVVVGLDWRLEGEHIHPGDIAPILAQIPPPDWLLSSRLWPGLGPLWRRFTGLIAAITRYGSARQGGDFAAGDRTDLRLPPQQVALIRAVAAANPRTVVVLMGGGAILTGDWDQLVPGLLLLWYPGEQGGHALAEVLLGTVSPAGRLPFAIPAEAAQLPPFEPRAPVVIYDLWHGYRRLQHQGERAAYPFGFGLSYSRFEASGLAIERQQDTEQSEAVRLAVSVRNAGTRAAAEVVQVYLEPPGLQMERPVRTLVAFQRLELEPGEQRRINLEIPLRRLSCFDEGRDGFVLEAGRHRLVVARHADDPGLGVDLTLTATFIGP